MKPQTGTKLATDGLPGIIKTIDEYLESPPRTRIEVRYFYHL